MAVIRIINEERVVCKRYKVTGTAYDSQKSFVKYLNCNNEEKIIEISNLSSTSVGYKRWKEFCANKILESAYVRLEELNTPCEGEIRLNPVDKNNGTSFPIVEDNPIETSGGGGYYDDGHRDNAPDLPSGNYVPIGGGSNEWERSM